MAIATFQAQSGFAVRKQGCEVPLLENGLILNVEVSAGGRSELVRALVDTGAAGTGIDARLASRLGLSPDGLSPISSAGGFAAAPFGTVSIRFHGTDLKPMERVKAYVCDLSVPVPMDCTGRVFTVASDTEMFLGRDVLSRWQIVWNGPQSTVTICD